MPTDLPTVLAAYSVAVTTPSGRIFPEITEGRRVFALINRGNNGLYLSDNAGVNESAGFLLLPGDTVILATASEVWITTGTVHVLILSR